MTDIGTDDVVAKALAEVAKARAWRERNEAERRRIFGAMPVRQSVYVLARTPKADELSKQ